MGYILNSKANQNRRFRSIRPKQHLGFSVGTQLTTQSAALDNTVTTRTPVQRVLAAHGDLKMLREEFGITSMEVVQKTKFRIGLSTYRNLESGKTKSPQLFTIRAIAIAFGITLDELSQLISNSN
jgi:DNA-binding XRE family transcriptional regulator